MSEPPPVASEEAKWPDASALKDRTPDWFKTTRRFTVFVALLSVAFVYFSWVPLWHTDLWGHLAYGRLIWERGEIPETEALLPLAAGEPLVDLCWLWQVGGYGVQSALGNTALQGLYALAITVSLGLIVWRVQRRTGDDAASVVAGVLFLWIAWHQLRVIRPQLVGTLLFIWLLAILTRGRRSKSDWYVVPAMFVLWANMHGSFAAGLLLLGAFAAGRAVDVWWRTGNWRSVGASRRLRRVGLLTLLAAGAVLVNPYGWRLYAEVLTFSRYDVLADMREWDPLTIRSLQGRAAALVAVALAFAYRLSPRRVRAGEVLSLIGFGFLALWVSRMIIWWAPVAAYYGTVHAAAIRGKAGKGAEATHEARGGLWTVAGLGLAWIAFAVSSVGNSALAGEKNDGPTTMSAWTPVELTRALHKVAADGQMFNTYEWGDYLLYKGPKRAEVFVATHAHVMPPEVWRHYMHVARMRPRWKQVLDHYEVQTVVLDRRYREVLILELKRMPEWKLRYEGGLGAVFTKAEVGRREGRRGAGSESREPRAEGDKTLE